MQFLEKIGGLLTLSMNISCCIYQTVALINPLNKKHLIANWIYMVNSTICFVLIYIGFSRNKYEFNLVAYFLTLFRLTIRLIDLEDTMKHNDNRFWFIFIVL